MNFTVKRYKIFFLLSITVITLSISYFSCQSNNEDILTSHERSWLQKNNNEIILSYDPKWPPFEFTNENNEYSGFSSQYISILEDKLGLKFKIIHSKNWKEAINKFKNNEIHVLPSISKTEERNKYMLFTKPYYNISPKIIVHQKIKKYLTINDLQGMTIGATNEYAIHDHLLKKFPHLKIRSFDNSLTGLMLISSGDIDAMIEIPAVALYYIKKKEILNLRVAGGINLKYELSIGLRKDLPILKTILEKGMSQISLGEFETIYQELNGNESEEFDKAIIIILQVSSILVLIIMILFLLKKILDKKNIKKTELFRPLFNLKIIVPVIIILSSLIILLLYSFSDKEVRTEEILSQEERQWLTNLDKQLIWGPCPDYPPIDFVDSIHGHNCYTRELITLLEKNIKYKFKVIHVKTFRELLNKARNKEIDIATSLAKTKDRSKYLIFTEPYMHVHNVYVTRDSVSYKITPEILKTHRISSSRGYAISGYLEEKYPFININYVDKDLTGILKVSFHESDIMATELPLALYYIKKHGISNIRFAGFTGYSYGLRIGSRNDMPMLNKILQKGLNSISIESKEAIYQKWVPPLETEFYKSRKFWYIIFISMSIISIFILIIAIWNRMLKKQVNQRTHELNEAANYLANIYNSIHSALISVNSEGDIKQINNTAIALTILDKDEIIGKKYWDAIPFLERFKESLSEIKKTKRSLEYHRHTIDHPDTTYFNVFFFPLVTTSGLDIVIRLDDITEIEHKDQQLIQAQKMETVGTLAGGLAHDFNNVLGGIVGALSLAHLKIIDLDDPIKTELLEYIMVMEESGQRATDMVQQLLSLSRKQELRLTPVDLNTVIKHVINICQNTFDKSIELRTVFHPKRAMIEADLTQIEQSLLNLCINASHAMTIMREKDKPSGGKLAITVEIINIDTHFQKSHPESELIDYWVISVQDTGVGMSIKTVAKIFDPFFTTKETGRGSGLGLLMVYNIIRQHNGFIDVYSEVDVGSTFRIFLPVIKHDVDTDYHVDEFKAAPKGEGLILIVDDEKIMRQMASAILKECGYEIITAQNGEECVDIFKNRHKEIHAVLLDLIMPKKSGKEAYEEMKKIDNNVKVCLSSGFIQDERVESLLDKGIKIFIQKPYTYGKLTKAIHKTITSD